MNALNELLQELGISKVRLAKYLNVSRQMVYNYLELPSLSKWPKEKKISLFKLLDIEDGDEERFDIITITSSLRWTPRKFKDETFDGYFYDPTDVDGKAQGYSALVNHLSQEITPSDVDEKSIKKVVSDISSASLIETQVLATT